MASPADRIRVLIVDDHGVVRAGIRALLASHPDFEIVGEAEDGATAISRCEALTPDVITLDATMPNTVSTRVARQIRRSAPATSILAFTEHEDPFYIHAMLDAGVHGYLSKRASDQLADAIRVVHRGERYLCRIAAAAIDEFRPRYVPSEDAVDPSMERAVARLSPRERAVLLLLAQGYTYQDIAEQLGVGVNSVGTYRARLAEKLGVQGRQDLVRVGLASGLVPRGGGRPDSSRSP